MLNFMVASNALIKSSSATNNKKSRVYILICKVFEWSSGARTFRRAIKSIYHMPIIGSGERFLIGHFSHIEGQFHFPLICLPSVTKINFACTSFHSDSKNTFWRGRKICHYFNQICRRVCEKSYASKSRWSRARHRRKASNQLTVKKWSDCVKSLCHKTKQGRAAENTHAHIRTLSIVAMAKNAAPVSRVIKLGH